MSKLTLNNVGNLIDATTAATVINDNSAAIVAAMENTLSRDGTTPNQMGSDLDMNSNNIINVDTIHTKTLILDGNVEGSSQWRSGVGAPASDLGNTGDMYLDTSTEDVYGPKTSSGWGSIATNIKGAQGPSGPKGDQGIQGVQGNAGPKGDQGDPGEGVIAGGTTGQILTKASNADYDTAWTSVAGSGTVTSVGLSLPSDLTVSNSPVTSSGTLTADWTITPTGTGAIVRANSPTLVTPIGITKSDVGLSNVDNTSDAIKNSSVSTLTNKTLTSPVINSPTGLVKADVGLGNVDNTSDATKNSATATLTNKTLTSPILTTPALGIATATSINGVVLDNTSWTSYTPTVTADSGTITSYSATGAYKNWGKTVWFRQTITLTTVGTAANLIIATLPFAVVGSSSCSGFWSNSGKLLTSEATGNPGRTFIRLYDGTFPFTDGAILNVTGTYERV